MDDELGAAFGRKSSFEISGERGGALQATEGSPVEHPTDSPYNLSRQGTIEHGMLDPLDPCVVETDEAHETLAWPGCEGEPQGLPPGVASGQETSFEVHHACPGLRRSAGGRARRRGQLVSL